MTSSCAYQDWFMDHVKTSIINKSFSPLYFTVGLVEESSELIQSLKQSNTDNIVSEVGDVLWYLYGLCQSLPDKIVPETENVDDEEADDDHGGVDDEGDDGVVLVPAEQLLGVCGALCGSIKKWSRGDKSWEMFQSRVQQQVSDVVRVVMNLSPVTLEEAMRQNIVKIRDRRQRGVVRGDGDNR